MVAVLHRWGSSVKGTETTRNRVVPSGYVLLCILLLFCASSSYAQEGVVFQHLTVAQGLSQGSVNCILQDSKGFMWFGTQDGLNRYDGYEFTLYKHNPADSTTLSDNWILSITEDQLGTLWIRTRGNPTKLNRFDRATQTFSLVEQRDLSMLGTRLNSVKAEYNEPSGVQWRGSIGGGVTRFDPKTGDTTVYRHNPANPGSLIDDRVYSICGDRYGTIWIGTMEGLENLDPRTGRIVHYRHDSKNLKSISDNWVWPIMEDRNGTLWVGTYRGGLNRFDRATETFTRYRHEEADPRSLSGDQLLSLHQDRSGVIWVGMNDRGVDRFHPELGAFVHFHREPGNSTSLIDNNILSIYLNRAGTAWVGTRGGVARFDRARGSFVHFTHSPSNPHSIGDNQAQVFLEDNAGTLWIGLVSKGLDRYDPATGRFMHYRNNPADANSLSDNRVYSLAEDRDGALWVGTYGGGLNRFNPRTGKFRRFLYDESIPGGLGAPGVFALCVDRDGTLWVGTFGGGLDRYDRATQTFTHFRHDAANATSLSDDVVACLYEDRSGTLWVGTAGGLNRFDRTNGTFRSYREKDGLPNDVVFGILEDSRGTLWLSTNKGLSRFDPERETFRNYDFNDGLQGDEFNQNAFASDPRTGELYFGGPNGLSVFQPENIKNNPYIPPVVFTAFSRYNTDDSEGKPIEEKGIDVKAGVTLSYKDNVASFEFAALNYYNTSKNQYAYRLLGYSDQWIRLGSERRATFTNLDGGDYLLQVKGSNNEGVWNEEGASLQLVVTPPWWKTTWAYAAYLALVFSGFYTVRRFELNRREQKAKIREAELREKAIVAEKRALEAENERQTKELEDARKLQLSLLPRDVPQLPGYDIAVFMKTATEVGGDYYDFSIGQDGALNVAFGDATGHGMQAGTIVTLMKGLFVSDAARFDIQAFFNHCSRAIKEIRLGRLFMAFTLVRLKGNHLSLSSAGMPPLFLHRSSDGSIEEILLKGMPLGAMKNFPYSLFESKLRTGDTLLLLTDGLPEQKNKQDEMFDYTRVQSAFASVVTRAPAEIIAHLVKSGETWMADVNQDDDITMLVIRKQGDPQEDVDHEGAL